MGFMGKPDNADNAIATVALITAGNNTHSTGFLHNHYDLPK